MKATVAAILELCVCMSVAAASENCAHRKPIDTPFGGLATTLCSDESNNRMYSISIDSKVVVRDSFLSQSSSSKDRSIWIFSGGPDGEIACARRLYLVDLSTQPVRVLAFGVKTACNEFHWASWGKSRSVIALNKNIRFVYENGKLTPPAKGERLFESIEPPHSIVGGGMTEESAVPFVESVPLPK